MRPFTYVAPTTLDEAIRILADNKGQARPLAGGSDLIDQLRAGRRQASIVVDVKKIPELLRLEYVDKEGLHIGAAATCSDIYSNPLVQEYYPSIEEGCRLIGSVQIQNRAGIGGNVCNAAPSADTVPPLLVYEARAIIAGAQGRREEPLGTFFIGPGKTVLQPDELLVEILVPPPAPNSSSHYLRFIPREEMDIAVAGVASLVALDPRTKRCIKARIALAAVAPTPVRAKQAEATLENKILNEATIMQAAELAPLAANPINDVRGTIEYRKELCKVLARRTLMRCMEHLRV